MSYFMRTIQNPEPRKEIFDRLARLDPATPPLWGTMTAPEMLAHRCAQMRMPYNDNPSPPVPGVQRYPVMRHCRDQNRSKVTISFAEVESTN